MTNFTTPSPELALRELNREARLALKSGDPALAMIKLKAALQIETKSVSLWLNYAAALRQSGDISGALTAVDQALTLDPRDFPALLMKGALLERGGQIVEAGRSYARALLLKPATVSDPALVAAIEHAEVIHAEYMNNLSTTIEASIGSLFSMSGGEPPRSVVRFADFTGGKRKLYTPQPGQYYFPGLPSQEFFDRELFPWIEKFESYTSVIAGELDVASRMHPELFKPYVSEDDSIPIDQWRDLNRSMNWSALHVIRAGRRQPMAADLFPKTLDALALLPQPEVSGRTPSAMFSALRPRTRIPAHTGVSNARLVLHLPLVVPEGCGFRVGSETRAWEVGKAWVFDDTINHEAWNESDETRVILIADIWNVFMTKAEQMAYASVVTAIDRFHGEATEGGDDL